MNNKVEPNNGLEADDDFTASMARLADLAAKDLGPDKPKEDKTLNVDDELLKEFMKPKRKAKPKGFKEKWAGKTIKLNVNPYVLSGIAIVILSVGIIAAPKISKHFEDKRLAIEAEEKRVALISKQTEKKLKSYSVFEAAKDVGGNTELKTKSMAELVKSVEEGNKAAEAKAAAESAQLALNTLSMNPEDLQFNLIGEEATDTEYTETSIVDINDPAYSWDLNDLTEIPEASFNSQQICPQDHNEIPNDEALASDIVQSYFVFNGKNC